MTKEEVDKLNPLQDLRELLAKYAVPAGDYSLEGRALGEKVEELWRLLTAIRGPDNEDYNLKDATTQFRIALHSRFFGYGNATVDSIPIPREGEPYFDYRDKIYGWVLRKASKKTQEHFVDHIVKAICLLRRLEGHTFEKSPVREDSRE